jgi:hypothetical protein
MRIVVILFLAGILVSLGSALYYMIRGGGEGGQRMFRALALRVGLSITLFVLLMAAYYFGFIPDRVN